MKKLLIIGCGQAGSTIANDWSKVNKNHIYAAINTSEKDGEKAYNIKNNYLISNGAVLGMAKERKRVIEAIREDAELPKFLRGLISDNKVQNIILISSSGGGTGSGLVPAICRVFHKKIKLRTILVTPELSEGCVTSFKNTLDVARELQEFDTAIRIVSNEKYEKKSNSLKKFSDINEYIISTEEQVINSGNQKAELENIDLAEIETLMFTAGYSPIYRMIADKEDLTLKMIDKINSSLDLPISSDKAIDYLGYIFYSKLEVKEKFSERDLENQIGRPLKKFRAVIPSDKESQVIMIAAGCSIPDALQKYQDEYEILSADVRSRKKKTFEINELKKEEFEFETEIKEEVKVVKKEEINWDEMTF